MSMIHYKKTNVWDNDNGEYDDQIVQNSYEIYIFIGYFQVGVLTLGSTSTWSIPYYVNNVNCI